MRESHGTWDTGLLCDTQILHLCEEHGMIEPFEREPVRQEPGGFVVGGARTAGRKVVSYGLGHYGYDIRVADEFKVFVPVWDSYVSDGVEHVDSVLVDPKRMDDRCFRTIQGDCIIPPNSFALARTVERFKIPRDVLGIVLGKSTYARCGLIVNCTPLEPEWEGYLTLEISNTTPLPAKVYANEGIAQILFYKASATCGTSYRDKRGKYMNQDKQIVLPKV